MLVNSAVLRYCGYRDSSKSMLVRGMVLNTLSVPLHKVKLHSDLVTGEVVIGLRPVLPIEGVHLILGNKLAGDRVWPNVPSSPMVLSEGDVIQAVVTRSMTKNTECVLTDEAKRVSKAVSLSIPDLSDLSFLSQMNGVRNNIQILHWLNYLLLFFLTVTYPMLPEHTLFRMDSC